MGLKALVINIKIKCAQKGMHANSKNQDTAGRAGTPYCLSETA